MPNISLESGQVNDRIKEAADSLRLLQITYLDAKGKPSIRTVEPYEIKEGKLFAHCRVADNIRAFKMDRIQSAVVHISEYTPRFPVLI